MQEPKRGPNFWIGNGIMAIAMVLLFFMGTIYEYLGTAAVLAWMVLAAVGMYFLMRSDD